MSDAIVVPGHMTQPHYIDRGAVAAMVEKLRAVESRGRLGVTTHWHRNPEGPEAADMIEALSRPMEAMAWREKVLAAVRPLLDREPMIDSSQAHKREIKAGWVADAILQALAVIPTEGLGSSADADTHRAAEGAVVAEDQPQFAVLWLHKGPFEASLVADLNGYVTGGSTRCLDALEAHGVEIYRRQPAAPTQGVETPAPAREGQS